MTTDIKALRDRVKFLQERLRFTHQKLTSMHGRDESNRALIDRLYNEWATIPPRIDMTQKALPFDGITFIIAAYDIPRQIQRTVMTCGPAYQKAPHLQVEVIIVDNGSTPAMKMEDFKKYPYVSQILRVEGKPSPIFGLNDAIKLAKFSNVALMIDGAHMLSPGVFNNARSVLQSFNNAIVNVPQYMLGNVSQNLKPPVDAFEVEEGDLLGLNWPNDGYALFDYAIFPGEAPVRDIYTAVESNCLITSKAVLETYGAYDPRFDEPGAGMANLELFMRLTRNPDNRYVTLPGEGSFHQDHDGTTTKPNPVDRQNLVAKYLAKFQEITGTEAPRNMTPPFYYGHVPLRAPFIQAVSRDYSDAKAKVLDELVKIYVMRAKYGQTGEVPHLVAKKPSIEHVMRPLLNPLGLKDDVAKQYGVTPVSLNYLNILKRVHEYAKPDLYFEIGVNVGESLAMSNCRSIGVDPSSDINVGFEAPTSVYRIESDKFFNNKARCERLFKDGIDLAFLDGMHLAEFIVRDFLNTERYMNKDGVIVIDDVFPEQPEMAGRPRPFNAWCGDVYKIILVLQKYRPDLTLSVFEAFIGPYRKGVVMITNLDPNNRTLDEAYSQIAKDIEAGEYDISDMSDLETFMPLVSPKDLEGILKNRSGQKAAKKAPAKKAPAKKAPAKKAPAKKATTKKAPAKKKPAAKKKAPAKKKS